MVSLQIAFVLLWRPSTTPTEIEIETIAVPKKPLYPFLYFEGWCLMLHRIRAFGDVFFWTLPWYDVMFGM